MTDFRRNQEAYPATLRTNLWPLCCGAMILSGFKDAAGKEEKALIKEINDACDSSIPDNQVYAGETIMPKLVFLTLNESQTKSAKIMTAVKAAGFTLLATASPRGSKQSFFIRDKSESFKLAAA